MSGDLYKEKYVNPKHTPYPLARCGMMFDSVKDKKLVYVMASRRHFGLLISLDALSDIESADDFLEQQVVLFQEAAKKFRSFANHYSRLCKEKYPKLKVPDPSGIGRNFFCLLCSISQSKSERKITDNYITNGDYLYVAPIGVDLTEFVSNINGATLH